MVDFVKIFMGYFILGAQTSEGVLLALRNLAHILSKECCKINFAHFYQKIIFLLNAFQLAKIQHFLMELRNYILPFILVGSFIILIRFI